MVFLRWSSIRERALKSILKVEFNESAKLSPFIGRLIETKGKIEEKMDHTRGVVASLGPISPLSPDPLSQTKGTKMELLAKEDCK